MQPEEESSDDSGSDNSDQEDENEDGDEDDGDDAAGDDDDGDDPQPHGGVAPGGGLQGHMQGEQATARQYSRDVCTEDSEWTVTNNNTRFACEP